MERDYTMTQATTEAEEPNKAEAPASVEVRPRRRRFTQAQKVAILEELDACERGDKGLLIRQKGLSSSVVYAWRHELQAGAGLAPKRRGKKAKHSSSMAAELAAVKRQLVRSQETNRQMQIVIDIQKKVSQILGVTLPEIAQ